MIKEDLKTVFDIDRPTPWPLPEFLKLDIPPVEFIVHDVIQKSGKTMVSGNPNTGKSLFAQALALDIGTGGSKFLGKFAVTKARVLYLDLEMGHSPLHGRFTKLCQAKGAISDNVFVYYIPSLNLLTDESKKLIEAWLEELAVDVLILDPLGNAWSGDESKQEQVGQLTTYLNTLISRFKIAIVVVHHWRKATDKAYTGGQMAAGSYKWAAWLDHHVTLEGEPHSITISCHKARNTSKFAPFIVKLNPDTLCFEFIADYEKKFDEGTLEVLFDSFNAFRVSVSDLIKRAGKQKSGSATTIRKLIKKTAVFNVVPVGNKHYLERKSDESIQEIDWKQ